VDCCGRCSNCRRIADGNFPDVLWLRPESKSRIIGVDHIRSLIQTMNLKPVEGGYKVGIIVAADRLRVEAANAFLKTLEEPPPRSILILLSSEPSRLLETILSRCLRLNFGGETPADPADIEWLRSFAGRLAVESAGLLEKYQIVSSLAERLEILRDDIDKKLEAGSPLEKYDDVDPDLREKWEEELKAAIEAEYRGRRAELLGLVQQWFRDVWVLSHGMNAAELSLPALAAESAAIARKLTPAQAHNNLVSLDGLQRLLHTNVQEALALEVGFLRLQTGTTAKA
jgi:DNA polymerase-3 subunit delta'